MVARQCSVCKHDAEPTALYCPNCGAGLPWSRGTASWERTPRAEKFNFTAQLISPGPDASLIIIQRGGWGDASVQLPWAVLVDDERAGRLGGNQTRGRVYLPPGTHAVRVRTALGVESGRLEVDTHAGETVRVRCDPVIFGKPSLCLTDDPDTKV